MAKLIHVMTILAVGAIYGPGTSFAESGQENAWGKVESKVEDVYRERADEDWQSFGQPAESARSRRIERLLNEAFMILGEARATQAVQEMEEIRKGIQDHRREIAHLRTERAGAPESAEISANPLSFIMAMVTKTKADYDRDIANRESAISDLEGRRDAIKDGMVSALAEIGITMSRGQIDSLLETVTAESMMQMHAVYQNLLKINQQLVEATESSGENVEVARRYYGIYAVLLELAVFMHDSFLEDVEKHKVTLDRITAEARDLKKQSTDMLRSIRDPALKRTLKANEEANELTIKASQIYKEYLGRQASEVTTARARVMQQHATAVLTHRTVRVSSRLVDLMRAQNQDFRTLMQIEIPQLRPFESIELRNEFERLTNELAVPTS